jgi:Uma2 family endonuclease
MSGDAARTIGPEFPNLAPDVIEGYRTAPETMVAEIIYGELSLMPRPGLEHAMAAEGLSEELRLGPRPDVLVPDLAAWRRERLPEGFITGAFAAVAPDWCCEVLSPSTEKVDRGRKLAIYHREEVGHVWLVSPVLRSVEVYRRADIGWLLLATFEGDAVVRAEPFDAVPLDLAGLWSL